MQLDIKYYLIDIHDNKKQRFIVRGDSEDTAKRDLINKGKKRLAHTTKKICGNSILIDYLSTKQSYALQEGCGTHKAITNKLKMINTCFNTIVVFGGEGRTCNHVTLNTL